METVKNTKVGNWLRANAPKVLDVVGDVLPDSGTLGIVKNLIDNDPDIPKEKILEFEAIRAEFEMNAQNNVTERWKADMASDAKIARVIRPAVMIALLVFFIAMMVWDGVDPEFIPRDSYVSLLEILMLTVFGSYFAGRTIEKTYRR